MALNTFNCNYLTPLHFNPFTADPVKALHFAIVAQPTILIFDIRALWRRARMSKIQNGGLDQYPLILWMRV